MSEKVSAFIEGEVPKEAIQKSRGDNWGKVQISGAGSGFWMIVLRQRNY